MPAKAPPIVPRHVDPAIRKELLAAVWYTCSKIVEEEEVDLQVIASEAFVATLAELVYAQAECLAKDLEAFAEHAGRTGILADDVKLVCRKNPQLFAELSKVLEKNTGPSAHKKQKKSA